MNHSSLSITFPSGKTEQVPFDTPISNLLQHFEPTNDEILAVRINNEICSIDSNVEINCKLEPIFKNTKDGANVYRRSLCLLLATAAHNLFPASHLLVGHSLGYGYYYTLDTGTPITQEQITSLENEMQRLVQNDLPVTTKTISYEDAIKLFEELNLTETRKQLNYIAPQKIRINCIDHFSDMYFGPLVRSTGTLKVFSLMKYGEGFLLRFPRSSDHSKLTTFVDQPILFGIYKKYKQWGKQIGVTSAASLNELINNRKIEEFIDITETFQQKCIADIADQIAASKKVKVILIAGPSSSGKTTTSKKLALELRAIGYKPKVISLDCYYVGRDRNPKDENGNYDYECLEALDIPLLNQNLVDLFDGKEVIIPSYDFNEGVPYFEEKNKMKLDANDILIMEGIHGLNDKLTPLIPQEQKFKIYLSALTQLNLDDHNRIPTSDNRLIRRIVRDAQYRGKNAADTIKMWPSVQRGEKLHIFPFQCKADVMLNTALDYELSVLKVYAMPLLQCVSPNEPEFAEATRLKNFLENFSPIPVTNVPGQSIIREFVGGSEFKY